MEHIRQLKLPDGLTLFLTLLGAVTFSLALLVIAFLSLPVAGQQKLWEEIGKLCAQFLVIVLLGLLVTGTLERMKSRGEERQAARQRQGDYIRRLIDLAHDLDQARLLIRADKTVDAWAEQMNVRVIPAYMELRDMYHDQMAIQATGKPFFRKDEDIIQDLKKMGWWFHAFCSEYSRHKELFAVDQRNLLRFLRNYDDRRDLWPKLDRLPLLQDYLYDPNFDPEPAKERNDPALSDLDTYHYEDFRAYYLDALTCMRMEFSKPRKRQPKTRKWERVEPSMGTLSSFPSRRGEPLGLGSQAAKPYDLFPDV